MFDQIDVRGVPYDETSLAGSVLDGHNSGPSVGMPIDPQSVGGESDD